MENRNVGFLVIGISLLIIGIVFIFNNALKNIVGASCSATHGAQVCPMYDTITTQTYLAIAIVGVLIIIGLVLIFTKPDERIVVRKIKEKKVVDSQAWKPKTSLGIKLYERISHSKPLSVFFLSPRRKNTSLFFLTSMSHS